ncbi:MAG: hypothetical protein P8177_09685 [Gemmatimonadota bacterium]
MRTIAAVAVLLLSGCSVLGGGGEDEGPRVPRSECDEYASQAIQTDDLQTAKTLAARAAECYASLQNR